MHTARSAMPTHSPSLSAVEYTATASAPRSWQARTRRTAASPRFAIRTRRSMGWLIPRGAWMLGAGWGALDVGSVPRAGWMMPWPRTIDVQRVADLGPSHGLRRSGAICDDADRGRSAAQFMESAI